MIHAVHTSLPDKRRVADALAHADRLEQQLPDRVLPFAEDWDLVILAKEIRRLRKMIDVP